MKPNFIIVFLTTLALGACTVKAPPMQTVESVDLPKFMGDWYVIAHIPTTLEKDAYNAIENYQLTPDGVIETTFTFNKGSLDGKKKTYRPSAIIRDEQTNATWGMQFIWPFRADYRIAWLDDDYSITVIARQKRDYVWLMARKPIMQQEKYDELVDFIGAIGYDTSKLRCVPHGENPEKP